MSEKTQQPKIIDFVRIKSWYVPANAESYRILRSIKVPLLKIHKDMIPTLKLATDRRNIRARAKDFSTILEKRLDDMGTAWKSKPGRTCKLTEKRLVFSAPCSDRNRRSIAKLEASFAKFCDRWGHKYIPLYSERDDRIRLVIDYLFDAGRNPVIESEPVQTERKFELALGFTKLVLTFLDRPLSAVTAENPSPRVMPPMIHLEVFTQMGSNWHSVHTATLVDQQIGDLSQMLTALSIMYDRRDQVDSGYEPSSQSTAAPKPPLRKDVADQLRDLVKQTEGRVLDLATASTEAQVEAHAKDLISIGRRIPRLNERLQQAGIDLVVSRQMLVENLDNANAAWLHLFTTRADGLTAEQRETAAASLWDRVKAVKDTWLKAELKDVVQALDLLKNVVSKE